MYNSESYWSEYTQREKTAIHLQLRIFIITLNDEYTKLNKDSVMKSRKTIGDIMDILKKYRTYGVLSWEDSTEILKSMSQSKKEKLIKCYLKIRNDFDVLLAQSRIQAKDEIVSICKEINYNLNNNAFN